MARALNPEWANAASDRYVEVTTSLAASLVTTGSHPARGHQSVGREPAAARPVGRPPQLGGRVGRRFGVEPRICATTRVTYESRDNAGHKFWVARYGRYAVRIDATRRGVYPWLITLEGRSVHNGVAPDRDQAADAVSDALDELPR